MSEPGRGQVLAPLVVRRHWGILRTPWVVRRMRKLPKREGLPSAYRFDGRAEDAAAFANGLFNETRGFTQKASGVTAARRGMRKPRHKREGDFDAGDLFDAVFDFAGNTGGGGGGGGFLDGLDEWALGVLALVVLAVAVVIAIPLGFIAVELAVVLIIGVLATAARVAGLKPWLLLISRDGRPVAAVAVRGWRASRAVIAALRARTT